MMSNKIQQILTALLLLTAMPLTAQVLFSEDFNSYPTGPLSNDPTGQTAGQGNWHVKSYLTNNINEAIVMSEPGKGNVLAMGKVGGPAHQGSNIEMKQPNLNILWDSRNSGNDILLLEYDVYIPSKTYGIMSNVRVGPLDLKIITKNYPEISYEYHIPNTPSGSLIYFRSDGTISRPGIKDYYTNFPYDTWISIQLFMDYNTMNIHFYIPVLNINNYWSVPYDNYYNIHGLVIKGEGLLDTPQENLKYDNIKVSALQTLPSYLNVNDFVSSKFNVFPNPVTDVVTITNNESIGIESIEIFDVSGKTVKSLSFNNENEVQLHMSDFAVGMYLLHIQTSEGMAVKKVVKR